MWSRYVKIITTTTSVTLSSKTRMAPASKKSLENRQTVCTDSSCHFFRGTDGSPFSPLAGHTTLGCCQSEVGHINHEQKEGRTFLRILIAPHFQSSSYYYSHSETCWSWMVPTSTASMISRNQQSVVRPQLLAGSCPFLDLKTFIE